VDLMFEYTRGVAFVEATPFIGVPKWADGSCGM
jgi:hypothetical protein